MPSGTVLVVGTSGSTGRPKLAMLTATALRASAQATHDRLGDPGRWLLAMPAHHIAGIQVLIRSIVAGTDPVVMDLRDGFGAAGFAAATAQLLAPCSDDGNSDGNGNGSSRAARRYTALVPTQVIRLLDDAAGLEALRCYDAVLLGGAASPAHVLDRAESAGVHLVTTYGMSETAGGCVYDGLPLDDTAIRLEQDGRVSLGGPTLAHGYLGEPKLTDRVFTQDRDGSRWFRTDDVGRLDPAGRLHVLGRVDDLINTGGLKVMPCQVEEALVTHVSGVIEAVVVGTPDPDWGQAVSAAVVVAQGCPSPTVADVRSHLRGILPDHTLPQRIVTVDVLPLRGPGKPDRGAVLGLFVPGA